MSFENPHNKRMSLPVLFLAIQYICLNMGQALSFGRINLSWISSVLLLIVFLYKNHGVIKLPSNKRIRILCLFFIGWTVYALLQIIIVKDIAVFFTFYIILITNLYTALMTILIVSKREELLFILYAFAFSFVLNLIAAGIEYFTGIHFVHYNESYYNLKVVVGFIGNFNDFCTYLFLAIVIFLICFFTSRKMIVKLLFTLCIVASIYFIYLNGSRGALYAIYVLLLFWGLLLILRLFVKDEKKYNYALFIISLISLAFFSAWIFKFGFYSALALLDNSGGGDIRSDQGRVKLIVEGMEQMIKSLGFGIGAGQSTLIHGINLHNFYAEIFSEYGIVFGAFSVYISFLVFVQKRNYINKMVDSLIQAAGFAFLVANVTSSSVNKMRALWIYFAIVFLIKETDFFSEKKMGS